MSILAAVDAGGSHTEAAIVDSTTTKIFRHTKGPSYLTEGRVREAALLIQQTIAETVSLSGSTQIDTLVIGAAGTGNPIVQSQLQSTLITANVARAIHVTSDAELQLEAAFGSGSGILISAGTGSIGVARNTNGVIRRVGGYGFRFGDEASGYAIGRDGIQAVLRAIDGRGPNTILVDLLRLETQTKDGNDFALWTRKVTRPVVAELSSVVMLACQAGDAVAWDIIHSAADALTEHVLALTSHVQTERITRVALAGGLLDHDTPLRTHTVERLITAISDIDLLPSRIDAISGALHMAKRMTRHFGH